MLSAKAGAAPTAPINTEQNESYQSDMLTSNKNLRHEIGELLFCLELPIGREYRQIGLELLEGLLRCYVSLTHAGEKA